MKIHNVIFFYCKGEDNLRNSLNAILKSFLCQLLTINPDVLPYLYEKCVQSREATIESFRPLRDLVAIAMDCKQPLFLVVDGLDECETKERKKIFNWILSLIGPNNGCNYNRLLIVSRDEGDFGKRLSKTPCIILQDTTAHSHEIRIYTNRKMTKIQKKFGISPQETAEIGNRVTLGAKGKLHSTVLSATPTLNTKLSRHVSFRTAGTEPLEESNFSYPASNRSKSFSLS